MAETVKAVCASCREERLDPSGLNYREVPYSQESCKCAFCGRKRYCAKYRIRYGRDRT